MSNLILYLTRFPLALVQGIYKSGSDLSAMPDRMRMLETGPCADSFARDLAPVVVVSDMFRTPESSLEAMQRKSGVQPPSYSHHNYGRAIDLAVSETLKRIKAINLASPYAIRLGNERLLQVGGGSEDIQAIVKDKRGLDLYLAERGWFCFRGDHKTGKAPGQPFDESWHYDYFGDAPNAPKYPYRNERAAAWKNNMAIYAHNWESILSAYQEGTIAGAAARLEIQRMLADVKTYHGKFDGILGPQSRQALKALQRAWKLKETGSPDPRTVQTLVYVTCQRVITDMVEVPLPT